MLLMNAHDTDAVICSLQFPLLKKVLFYNLLKGKRNTGGGGGLVEQDNPLSIS